MKWLARLAIVSCVVALGLRAAESEAPFTDTLTSEQKERLGLGTLTPEQQAALNAAVAAYTHGAKAVAVKEAVAQAQQQSDQKLEQAQKKAAADAVAEYKKKEEPGLIARTIDKFRKRQEEDKLERFTGRIVGEFRGWRGGTYFPLTNGEVWRQVGTDTYELPPVQNAEAEFYQSKNGYWRMKYDGAWITVKRLQ